MERDTQTSFQIKPLPCACEKGFDAWVFLARPNKPEQTQKNHRSVLAETIMSKPENRCFALLAVLVLLAKGSVVNAAVSPKNIEQLRQADLIVVGVIDKVMVESERSRVERGFGNYDWGIHLTPRLQQTALNC